MGNRALIIFTDGEEYSPTTYMHWNGGDVAAALTELFTLMADRGTDISYGTARFLGILHDKMPGNLSLGCFNTPPRPQGKSYEQWLTDMSHGDAGAILVDFKTGQVHCYGGYGLVIGSERFPKQAVPFQKLTTIASWHKQTVTK
jgi:hypothetical protein